MFISLAAVAQWIARLPPVFNFDSKRLWVHLNMVRSKPTSPIRGENIPITC